MANIWETTYLNTLTDALDALIELRKKNWLCRGQSKRYGCLIPSIDRPPRLNLTRKEKLDLERMSINCFRSLVQHFADQGEVYALYNDLIALMVLRHYGVPTRLLDWSISPWVAAYFATFGNAKNEGELWAFNEALYEVEGAKQWEKWPATRSETSEDPNKFSPHSAFLDEEPDDWVVCHFYGQGFPRQKAQMGAYSMTAQFGRDHANSIQELLKRNDSFHQYIFDPALKPRMQKFLREYFKIWRGTLFPDSAGAAETSRRLVFPEKI